MSAAPAFLAPAEVPLTLRAKALVVRPMSVGQICRLLQVAVEPVQLLMSIPPDVVERLTSDDGPGLDDLQQLFEVLSEQPERFVQMVAVATLQDDDYVAGLLPDEFALLFATVVQVNADFFGQAAPVFGAAGRRLKRLDASEASTPPGPAPSTT